MNKRVVDLGIIPTGTGFSLSIPISTGALQYMVPISDSDLCVFLETALKSEPRRFGENPTSCKPRG